MNKPLKLITLAMFSTTVSACQTVDNTLDKTWEPVTEADKPDTYDEACYDRKKAKETPFCPAYDPSKDYPLD